MIDARWIKTGIGRYIVSLLEGLNEQLPAVDIACITHPQHVNALSKFCDRLILSKAGIYSIHEQLALPWLARNFAAFYAPHYNVPLSWPRKLLVTIHDLNHILDRTYRSSWKSKIYGAPILKVAAKKAHKIITPSSYTKSMLCEHLRVSEDRVTVIPCPLSIHFYACDKSESRSLIKQGFSIEWPYVLYVGNLAPNKNIPLLLKAFAILQSKRRDAPDLVVVGGDKSSRRELQNRAKTLSISDKITWLENVSDDLLARLYAAAEATIVPSLEEGFGLPVIESMACGTPVICSNSASLPEVAADAALFFDPYSAEGLTETIIAILDSMETRRQMISAGLKRAANFSQKDFVSRQAEAITQLLSSV